MSDGVQATRVLVVEDEQHLAQGLLFNLQAEGYDVTLAFDGESGMGMLTDPETPPFDAVLLDVMLPGCDGFSVASELRAGGNFVPILMLTARGRPEDVLAGLEAGAGRLCSEAIRPERAARAAACSAAARGVGAARRSQTR